MGKINHNLSFNFFNYGRTAITTANRTVSTSSYVGGSAGYTADSTDYAGCIARRSTSSLDHTDDSASSSANSTVASSNSSIWC